MSSSAFLGVCEAVEAFVLRSRGQGNLSVIGYPSSLGYVYPWVLLGTVGCIQSHTRHCGLYSRQAARTQLVLWVDFLTLLSGVKEIIAVLQSCSWIGTCLSWDGLTQAIPDRGRIRELYRSGALESETRGSVTDPMGLTSVCCTQNIPIVEFLRALGS